MEWNELKGSGLKDLLTAIDTVGREIDTVGKNLNQEDEIAVRLHSAIEDAYWSTCDRVQDIIVHLTN